MDKPVAQLIFNGKRSEVNFFFVSEFLAHARNSHFNVPEQSGLVDYYGIIKVIKSSVYVDFVMTVQSLDIYDRPVFNVFVNLAVNRNAVELLIFLELSDLNEQYKTAIDLLKCWAYDFKSRYRLACVICKRDYDDIDKYIFNDNGSGPSYDEYIA